MKALTLYPHEIRRLLSTGSVTVWRPIKPQPPAYINDLHGGELSKRAPYALEDNETGIIIGMGFFDDDDMPYICPHPPGSERWVRETWSYYCDYENLYDCIRYKTDGACKKPEFHRFPNVSENTWYRFSMLCDGCGCKDHSWRSPVTMPRWASRLSVVSRAAEARQVQTVTEEEAVEAGLADLIAFSEWWRWRFDTLGPDPWAWATTLEVKQ